MGCSLISSSLIPPSLRPARVRGDGRAGGPPPAGEELSGLPLRGLEVDRDRGEVNPPIECRLGIPFRGVVSVILRGIPRDLRGTVGAGFFFRLFCASVDFWSSSARKAADLGFRFNVKCFVGTDCKEN